MMDSNGSKKNKVLDRINGIGNEQAAEISKTSGMDLSREVENQRNVWIFGGVISLLPVVFIGIVRFFVLGASRATIVTIFANTSIMYTGVTLLVSAMNDLHFSSEYKNKAKKLFLIYFCLLLTIVILYCAMEACSFIMENFPITGTGENISEGMMFSIILIVLNFVSVIVPVVIGWKLQYGESLKRLRNGG